MYRYFGGFFYPHSMKHRYEPQGTWPDGGVDVDEPTFSEFTSQPPAGKQLGEDASGMPSWVDIPARPNHELLHEILGRISAAYQEDMSKLNQAYLAAIVSDGPSEETKQMAVRSAIEERKAAYVSEKNSAREMYQT
jgi:hypothetical protein